MLTDGLENSSRYSLKELRELARESDVAIFVLGSGPKAGAAGPAMQKLVEETGGRVFVTDDATLPDICTRIALELRHQYSIGYYPTADTRDGRWHAIRVELDPPAGLPRLHVHARKGYYGLGRRSSP